MPSTTLSYSLASSQNDPANVRGADAGEDVSGEFERRREAGETGWQALRRKARRAPTRRLARTLDILQESCEHYGRAADLLLQAWRGSGGGPKAEREAKRGRRLLLGALGMLPPGEAQALPVVEAKSSESNIDPLYGRIAGEIAKDQTEARCWSGRG
jgi:hypothetical protein